MRTWILFWVATPVVIAGCTSSRRAAPTGVISGTGSPCVGNVIVDPAKFDQLTVAVTLLDGAGRTRIQTVKFPWKFTFVVSPGTYVLSESGAPRVTVHVNGGRTTRATLTAECL